MTQIEAVGLYTALNLILLALLAVPIGLNRNKKKISLGDGGDASMTALVRAHGNAAEWIPGALIGLFLLAQMQASVMVIHAIGIAFTFARASHAFAFVSGQTVSIFRLLGAGITLLVYLALAVILLMKVFG